MKKFNLRLAELGHPLVTKDGRKIVNFFIQQEDGSIIVSLEQLGGRSLTEKEVRLDETPKNWKPNYKLGDKILVFNEGDYKEKIFVMWGRDNSVICVYSYYEESFKRKEFFKTTTWVYWKIPELKEETLDIKITLNGKEINPSEFSEETWNNLRKQ